MKTPIKHRLDLAEKLLQLQLDNYHTDRAKKQIVSFCFTREADRIQVFAIDVDGSPGKTFHFGETITPICNVCLLAFWIDTNDSGTIYASIF